MYSSNRGPDTILVNGKIVTVDKDFAIVDALSIREERFRTVGTNDEVRRSAGRTAKVIDLQGRCVIPGLIEGHAHPEMASLSEANEPIPDVRDMRDLLEWIAACAAARSRGEWIVHPKFFFTRLNEMRSPTRSELDAAAPENPVFLNGTYGGVVNSEAIRRSGIVEATAPEDFMRDGDSGRLSGLLRASSFHLLALPEERTFSFTEQLNALEIMLARYNQIGITSVCAGSDTADSLNLYRTLRDEARLSVRICQNIYVPFDFTIPLEQIAQKLSELGMCTGDGDRWVRIGALKTTMDGGILTGTAFLREPWGPKAESTYGAQGDGYRGVLLVSEDELTPLVKAAHRTGWKFTAHCTGGGAMDVMLAAFEAADSERTIRDGRFSIIHGNFFTPEAIDTMGRLGVCAEMQPAWFYKDSRAMRKVLGEERCRTFHPYKSLFDSCVMVHGGSDHMVVLDPDRSINPYNPFLAMWSVISRENETGQVIDRCQALTREQALRMYTIHNAFATFEEEEKGSIEAGKLADLVVLSDDYLSCPLERIKQIKPLMTMVGGEIVYSNEGVSQPT